LNGLTLDRCCLDAIKNCDGQCAMQMSGKMMERFRGELSLNAPDYEGAGNSSHAGSST
jgi:hypothetical protein